MAGSSDGPWVVGRTTHGLAEALSRRFAPCCAGSGAAAPARSPLSSLRPPVTQTDSGPAEPHGAAEALIPAQTSRGLLSRP